MPNEKTEKVDALVFTDGILIISRQDSKVIEFIKFYSKITENFVEISKNQRKNFDSIILISPRFKSLKFELLFNDFFRDNFHDVIVDTKKKFLSVFRLSFSEIHLNTSLGTNFASDIIIQVNQIVPAEKKLTNKRFLV